MANQKQVARAAAAAAAQEALQAKKQRLIIVSLIAAAVVVALIIGLVIAGNREEPLPEGTLTGKHYVQIDVQDYGTITAELDADAAPRTVTNFMELVESGFYNGLTFHRIIDGFMIQGGDPNGNGTGGSGKNIKGEFKQNGWDNPIAHERGVLSMARSNAPDSASSQFFIMHQAAPHLDGAYAAFGHVLSGIEIVDAICANTPVTDGNGTVLQANQPVITSVKRIDPPTK